MKLLNATLRPGRVIEVLDSGNVKVEAPGLFSAEDKDLLPPVMPFFGLHANTYSEPKEYDDVWVLNLDDNPMQLFWFRKDDRTEHNNDIEAEENVEILCNREAGTGYATIYFSDGTGWMFRNGEAFMNIKKDGTIVINSSGGQVLHVTNNGISLGKEDKSAHPCAFGDKTKEALDMIASCLDMIRQTCAPISILSPIASSINTWPERIKAQAAQVPSNIVTLE